MTVFSFCLAIGFARTAQENRKKTLSAISRPSSRRRPLLTPVGSAASAARAQSFATSHPYLRVVDQMATRTQQVAARLGASKDDCVSTRILRNDQAASTSERRSRSCAAASGPPLTLTVSAHDQLRHRASSADVPVPDLRAPEETDEAAHDKERPVREIVPEPAASRGQKHGCKEPG